MAPLAKVVLRESKDEADMELVWELILQPCFASGEAFCIAADISKEDALAYWSWPGNSSCRVFVAEIVVEDGELSTDAVADGLGKPIGSFFIAPAQRGNGAHVATCAFAVAPKAKDKGAAPN